MCACVCGVREGGRAEMRLRRVTRCMYMIVITARCGDVTGGGEGVRQRYLQRVGLARGEKTGKK